MPIPEGLRDYAKQLGFPGSETLAKIFEIIYNEDDDLAVVQALPGTIEELADRTGLSPNRVSMVTENLLNKGYITVDFKRQDVFRRFPAMIELRDFSILGENKPEALFKLWDRLILNESATMVSNLIEAKVAPMVRVVPIEHSVATQNRVLDIDSARKIFKEAELITAIPCVCRLVARKHGRGTDCPAPENSVCMQTNLFSSLVLARNLGKAISNDEALKRIGEAEDAGLVHVVRNNVNKDMLMCNCCSCCCSSLFFLKQMGYDDSMAPSRFKVKLDADACSGCGTCEDRCQFKAIVVDDIATIDQDACYGCGNCVVTCEDDALTLEEFYPKEHIRVK